MLIFANPTTVQCNMLNEKKNENKMSIQIYICNIEYTHD